MARPTFTSTGMIIVASCSDGSPAPGFQVREAVLTAILGQHLINGKFQITMV